MVVLIVAVSAFAQTAVPTSVNDIVNKAAAQRKAYIEEFKNLLSRETKTFQTVGKNGDIKRSKVIVSTFLVYQLAGNDGKVTEFRSVDSVDGKTIEGVEARTQSFFQTVAKAGSNEKQLDAIIKESTRYDDGLIIDGVTLYQALELADNLRPAFKFTSRGQDDFGGKSVYVIDYEQTTPSPYIYTGSRKKVGDDLLSFSFNSGYGDRDVDARLSGTLFIDTNTFQIRREIRKATISPRRDGNRVTVSEADFQYTDSEFGILPPKKIVLTEFKPKGGDVQKEAVVNFDYDKFRRPETDVKIIEESMLVSPYDQLNTP